MADEFLLSDDLLRQLMSVGEVDLLVGIPSHNNAGTIGPVVDMIEQTFQRCFPRERAVIINVDGGSTDGTLEILRSPVVHKSLSARGLTSLRTTHRIVTKYGSAPSPGIAFRILLAAADLLQAKACAVISPDAPSSTDAWIAPLLEPIYRQNFDFVAPLYCRHRFDGLLARDLLYPMGRAIYGKRLREFHSTELAFSGRLATDCLNQEVWNEGPVQASPETWMAVTALTSDFRCCQSFLGPKTHSVTASAADIVTVVRHIVGALFWSIDSRDSVWTNRVGSEPIPTFGPDHELQPNGPRVNRERIFELFRSGVSELSPILKSILAPETEAEIQRVAALDGHNFRFDHALWTRTLFDFAVAYHYSVLNRDHLVQALVPLYRGRICSFMLQHQDSSAEEIEADSEKLCLEFERQKPYLIEKWKVRNEVKS